MTRAIFALEAIDEIEDAVIRYNRERPNLGDELSSEAERIVEQAVSFPHSGAPHLAGTRRTHLNRFPFYIVYRLVTGGIEVLAVAHDRRRHGYWRSRL